MTKRLYFAITKRCNLQCAHCFNDSGGMAADELTTDQICRILRAGRDYGFSQVQLTGGEPLIRPDIFQILAWAQKEKMIVFLQSNGVIGDGVMARLLDEDPEFLQFIISLDGFKTNSSFRGSAATTGSVRSIRTLAKRFQLRINALLSNDIARGEIDALIDLARRTGATLAFNPVIPMGRGQLANMMAPARYFFETTRIRADHVRCGFSCDAESGRLRENEDCSVRRGEGFFVAANGDCYPCGFLEEVPGMKLGNLIADRDGFAAMFDGYPAACRQIAAECAACDHHLGRQCHGGCPARIYAIHRRFDRPEHYCMRTYGEEASNACQIPGKNGVGRRRDF